MASTAAAYWPPLQDVQAWVDGSYVRFKVYDPQQLAWQVGSAGPYDEVYLISRDGVVAWRQRTGTQWHVCFAAYDPGRSAWQVGSYPSAFDEVYFDNRGGIVVWRQRTANPGFPEWRVQFAIYDPVQGAWRYGSSVAVSAADFVTQDGVAAWRQRISSPGNPEWHAGYTVYDPAMGLWRSENTIAYDSVTVSITNATVTYTADGTSHTRGYSVSSGSWYGGPTQPCASFVAAPTSGSPGLWVWLTDMSVGSTAWSWTFGDGQTSSDRSPSHTYPDPGTYPVAQNATGPAGSSTAHDTIVVGSSLDVGVSAILAPAGVVDSGQVVTPRARVENYGWSPASFPVIFTIAPAFACTLAVTDLAAGDTAVVACSSWTAVGRGAHAVRCSCALAGDENPANDAHSASTFVRVQDACAASIQAPVGTVDSGAVITPVATVRNDGDVAATFSATFRVGTFYTDVQSTDSLLPGDSVQLSFAPWTVTEMGTHAVCCSTMLAGDVYPENNCLDDSVQVQPATGIDLRTEPPLRTELDAIAPNPFAGGTAIRYAASHRCRVTLRLYSTSGALVRTLANSYQAAGRRTVTWDGLDDRGRSVGRGAYHCRFTAGAFTASAVLIKAE